MRGSRRVLRSGCLVLIGLFLAPAVSPPAAAQNSLSAKRREAARLDAKIEETTVRLERLNEDFLVASERLASLQKKLARSQQSEKLSNRRVEQLRSRLHQQGLRVFTNPTGSSIDAFSNSATIADVERKLAIGEQRTLSLADTVDLLQAERADRERATKQLAQARKDAEETKSAIAKKRANADALFVELQDLEAQVSGELATLIEKERKARELAQRRQLEAAENRERERARAELGVLAAQRAADERRNSPRDAQRNAQRDAGLRRRSGRNGATAAETASPSRTTTRETSAAPSRQRLEVEAGLVEVSPSPGANQAVSVAMAQLGKPYVWAAEGPGAYDCSGLTLYAWRAAGRRLPHSSRIQFATTKRVPLSQRQPGDLLFFGRPIHHVGMYIGNDQMVEAPHRRARVRVKSIFRKDFVGMGRVT